MQTPRPFTRIYEKRDRVRTILIPNLTPEFSEIMKVAMESEGYKTQILPLAGEEAVELGKHYVHNDMCFPAQLNIGEMLFALRSGQYDLNLSSVGLSKNCNACRALQYFSLTRRALDACGFTDVPVITSGKDVLGVQPGMRLGVKFRLKAMQGILYVDALNEMRLRLLPYETVPGSTEELHRRYLTEGMTALRRGFRPLKRVLRRAVAAFNAIPAHRPARKPRVGIVGEILVNYHPTGNYRIVEYLLANGMEVHLPPLIEFFRQDIVNWEIAGKRGLSESPRLSRLYSFLAGIAYGAHSRPIERILMGFKYYERREEIAEIKDNAVSIIDPAFNSGEGWLLPGEIVSMIKKGVQSFVIVQPFGCLPNHVSGRGIMKAVKEQHPHVQLLSLDFDPDVSSGNIENRLQMLIVNARMSNRSI